jgi:ubiquitin-protein ligase E3 C
MFQTFTGSSRRPRQVNLSGQNANPFAASSAGSAPAIQKAVVNAQQERQQRQLDRDRLNASKQIQRIWRGYRVRSDLANSQRALWDEVASASDAGEYATVVEQLKFLVLFFNSSQRQDILRLLSLAQRIEALGCSRFLGEQQIHLKLPKLAKFALESLTKLGSLLYNNLSWLIYVSSLPRCPLPLLDLLVGIFEQHPTAFPPISQPYYTYISSLLSSSDLKQIDRSLLVSAIQVPLTRSGDAKVSGALSHGRCNIENTDH